MAKDTKADKKTEHPRSFRFDDQMKADLEECAEISKSTDTEVLRQALRALARKLRRENA